MTTHHIFHTDDPTEAGVIAAALAAHRSGIQSSVPVAPVAPALPAMPGVGAAVAPPTMPGLPAVATAAPPPPPPPPVAVDPALMIAPEGWTADAMKTALKWWAANGKGSPADMKAICVKYSPVGAPSPGFKTVYPAKWPELYAELTT